MSVISVGNFEEQTTSEAVWEDDSTTNEWSFTMSGSSPFNTPSGSSVRSEFGSIEMNIESTISLELSIRSEMSFVSSRIEKFLVSFSNSSLIVAGCEFIEHVFVFQVSVNNSWYSMGSSKFCLSLKGSSEMAGVLGCA